MSETLERYSRMRSAGVPIIVAATPDPVDFVADIINNLEAFSEKNNWSAERIEREVENISFYRWDSIRGLDALNDNARNNITNVDNPERMGGKPDVVLKSLHRIPENAVVFMHIKQEHLSDPVVRQGIANVRDEFKANYRTLILIGQQLQMPFELTGEVLYIDEELPSREVIRKTIVDTAASVSLEVTDSQVDDSVEALCGLTQFQAEQLVAVNMRSTGILVDELWHAKKRVIGQTPGLTMFESDETFDDLIGLENIKSFIARIFDGANRPNAIVFIDELEKSINTNTNDSSGVSLDQLQNVLTEMTDTDAMGILLFGVPGVGKSAISKAASNYGGVPNLKFDFGAAKGSHVGQSEAQIRMALKKIRAISSGKTLWLATCNSVDSLPAELRSRFSFGSFFFDIPGCVQRGDLWKLYMGKYGLTGDTAPSVQNWTGREIRNCCRIAHDLSIPLKEAKGYVVPIIESAKARVNDIRKQANNCFLDADRPGKYTMSRKAETKSGRSIGLDN